MFPGSLVGIICFVRYNNCVRNDPDGGAQCNMKPRHVESEMNGDFVLLTTVRKGLFLFVYTFSSGMVTATGKNKNGNKDLVSRFFNFCVRLRVLFQCRQ